MSVSSDVNQFCKDKENMSKPKYYDSLGFRNMSENLTDMVFATAASPAWWGIDDGLVLLKKGQIKKIGGWEEGTNHLCLLQHSTRKSVYCVGFAHSITAMLGSPAGKLETKQWDTTLHCLFQEHEMEVITKIKLPS
jgi:hypothetical protein